MNETVQDVVTDPSDAFKKSNGYGLTGIGNIKNRNLEAQKERATSAISKYSAVVFTVP